MTPPTQKIRLILELRRIGITDTEILSAFEKVPRDMFVPDTFVDQTWEDTPLPIGHGQTISQPTVVARMIQALGPDPMRNVLEVGCGSGYQTAVLSYLFRRVFAIERETKLFRVAVERLAELRRYNVTAKPGDGSLGWAEQAPFDRILVAAAAEDIPPVLFEQLAPNGVMVCPVGEAASEQRLLRVTRSGDGRDVEDIGPVRFVPLVSDREERMLRKAG
ncbi:MAG: protein-L-isoaspartate(D-aspartate) O-methyltransferase [Pseudomonadota bacterium]